MCRGRDSSLSMLLGVAGSVLVALSRLSWVLACLIRLPGWSADRGQ
jgi:hypothetical protein